MPPYYIEWFKSRYLGVLLPTEKKLILQVLNALRGMRTAGKIFNDKIDETRPRVRVMTPSGYMWESPDGWWFDEP